MSARILQGDVLAVLRDLPEKSFDCCVTSPPYFGLRDYGVEGQIGSEPTMVAYLTKIVEVCQEIWRVLKDEGTFWLNIGDSYCSTDKWGGGKNGNSGKHSKADDGTIPSWAIRQKRQPQLGLKPKDLMMVPNRLAIALQDDGWYVRSEIIWHKPNPMPESVRDRPTNAHEKLWLLTKKLSYYYDADAIKNPPAESFLKEIAEGYNGTAKKDFGASGAQQASATKTRIIEKAREKIDKQRGHIRRHAGFNGRWDSLTRDEQMALGSNARNVWSISPQPFPGAHFATFPEKLVEKCLLAGCPLNGSVLDPFGGSGTTGVVANRLGRHATLIDINEKYCEMARKRIDAEFDLCILL